MLVCERLQGDYPTGDKSYWSVLTSRRITESQLKILEMASKGGGKELPPLTNDQKAELTAAFHHMDKDKDGYIKIRDLSSVLNSDNTEYNEELIAQADTDEDGAVSLEEFMSYMEEKLSLKDTEEELMEAFRVFDKEGNGFLNCTEVRRVMTNLGTKLTDTQVDLMVQEADLDGDGQINYEEFVRGMFSKAKW